MAKPWEKYANPQGIPIGPQDPTMQYKGPQAQANLDNTRSNIANDAERLRIAQAQLAIAQQQAAQQSREQDAKIAGSREEAIASQRAALMKDISQAQSNDEILAAINRARGMASGWSTGIGAQLFGGIGGTDATDLQSQITTIGAGTTFEKLNNLREQSATGASGLGQLSNQEGNLLRDSVAALNPRQSEGEFRKGLDAVEQHYKNNQQINAASSIYGNEMERRRAKFIAEYRGRGDPAKIWDQVAVPTGQAQLRNRVANMLKNAPRTNKGGGGWKVERLD